jgi:CRP-like cAMP-binding protein
MADLKNVKLFHGMPEGELKKIAKRMQEVNHSAGSEVIIQGRNGVGFMVILSGEAEVAIPGGRQRSLGPGDHFGEMALVDHQGRSASITAKTDLKLLAVPNGSFLRP